VKPLLILRFRARLIFYKIRKAIASTYNAIKLPLPMDKDSDYEDHYARWSYEQLLLQQPHIKFNGLWRIGCNHYIVCEDAEGAQTTDGENLLKWFHNNCVIASPVYLVTSAPAKAERVPDRHSSDRALVAGAPRNRRQLLVDLGLALPRNFPPFTLDNPDATVVLVTNRPLTEDQKKQANTKFASLGYFTPLEFSHDSQRNLQSKFRYDFGQGDIDLIPSRELGSNYSRDLRLLVERDEDFWVDNRNRVLSTFYTKVNKLLPREWTSGRSLGCFVDATVFPPDNIRTYLSLYDTVYLALPLAAEFDINCTALGVSPAELQELVHHGRVKIVLPQSVDRYPEKWLGAIAEAAPTGLMLSRQLAAVTITDARRRNPLLYTPLSPVQRYALLHFLASHAEDLVGKEKGEKFVRFIAELGDRWSQTEWSVQSRGAMGMSHLGIGSIAATVYQQVSGRDLRLELWSAAQKVEWAAALGAHAFPIVKGEYDETVACDMVAGLYGPLVKKNSLPPHAALSAVTNLLAIDNNISVVEFAKEFSSSDINRLRGLLFRLSYENVGEHQLSDAITKFNAEIRHYEKRPDLLKSLNIVGLCSAGTVAAGAIDPSIQKIVPLAGIILGFAVNRLIDEAPRYSASAGTLIDYLNSLLTWRSNAGAVLVSRARKDITRLKR